MYTLKSGDVTIVMGVGAISRCAGRVLVERLVPRPHRGQPCTLVLLLPAMLREWPALLESARRRTGPVVILTAHHVEPPGLEPEWSVISAPPLLESYLGEIDALRQSGQLRCVWPHYPSGLSTLQDVVDHVGPALEQGRITLTYAPTTPAAITLALRRSMLRLSNPSTLPQALFSWLDLDGSRTLSPSELGLALRALDQSGPDALLAAHDHSWMTPLDLDTFASFIRDSHVDFVRDIIFEPHPTVSTASWRVDVALAQGNTFAQAGAIEVMLGLLGQGAGAGTRDLVQQWWDRLVLSVLGLTFVPAVGLLRQRRIQLDGLLGSMSVLLDSRDEILVARRSDDHTRFHAIRQRTIADPQVHTWSQGKRWVSLTLDGDRNITAIEVENRWSGQAVAVGAMLRRETVSPATIDAFEKTGGFVLDVSLAADNPIICRCAQARRSDVDSLMASGARTVRALAENQGITAVCGGCLPTVKALLEGRTVAAAPSKASASRSRKEIVAAGFDAQRPEDPREEADAFFLQMLDEGGATPSRRRQVLTELDQTGTWVPTIEELTWGARVAWRNSTRCIGRYFWDSLTVLDQRSAQTGQDIFEALCEHIAFATNGGEIRSTMSVFSPAGADGIGPRLWNPQLIRYAAHRLPDGRVLGDPIHLALTDAIKALGWRAAHPTAFDVLPIVVELPGQPPEWFEIPSDLILEVPISHPDHPEIGALGMKWHALPAVSNMSLDMGGLTHTMAPFNGFYMGSEIGARNLSDEDRYNLLPEVARRLGMDTQSRATLWRERAQLELTHAVQHSFAAAGVRMMDHHALSDWFLRFEQEETDLGRTVYADWGWIVPPLGGSTTPVFFKTHWENRVLKPGLFYLPDIHQSGCPMGFGTPADAPEQRCPFSTKD